MERGGVGLGVVAGSDREKELETHLRGPKCWHVLEYFIYIFFAWMIYRKANLIVFSLCDEVVDCCGVSTLWNTTLKAAIEL